MRFLDKLLNVGGQAISTETPERVSLPVGAFWDDFFRLVARKNGFYAFEGALHLFPSAKEGCMPVRLWNSSELWRYTYNGLFSSEIHFFAEDAFGCQFGASGDAVYFLNAETGYLKMHSQCLEEWAEKLLKDYAVETGYPLAHEWQVKNGRIPGNCRLVPEVPFVLGGKFAVDNLIPVRSIQAMRYYGKLASDLAVRKDGEVIRFDPVVVRRLRYSDS